MKVLNTQSALINSLMSYKDISNQTVAISNLCTTQTLVYINDAYTNIYLYSEYFNGYVRAI